MLLIVCDKMEDNYLQILVCVLHTSIVGLSSLIGVVYKTIGGKVFKEQRVKRQATNCGVSSLLGGGHVVVGVFCVDGW